MNRFIFGENPIDRLKRKVKEFEEERDSLKFQLNENEEKMGHSSISLAHVESSRLMYQAVIEERKCKIRSIYSPNNIHIKLFITIITPTVKAIRIILISTQFSYIFVSFFSKFLKASIYNTSLSNWSLNVK
ncbi:hypothetical protein H5410_051374 [Solanum commersonii]|uniref:Uncharacterized protein n=1 Tax=Solanum commersonii TaxID=4109 RepID=A0A9J5WY81_SOLCO|nr:hypothetical protein H5410_051374 [Solanum commersonii]